MPKLKGFTKPKVISLWKSDKFENRFPEISVSGRPTDVFAACLSYDLLIPVNGKAKKSLDIFEETILRMVKLKRSTPSELADVLCLEKDLINFILIRMRESGMLKDNQTVSEKGDELLNFQSSLRTEMETIQGKMFVIKKTGLVLPYIHIGEFQSESVVDFDQKTITFEFGSIGDHDSVKGSRINDWAVDKIPPQVLDARTVKKAILTYNKIAKAKNMDEINLCQD